MNRLIDPSIKFARRLATAIRNCSLWPVLVICVSLTACMSEIRADTRMQAIDVLQLFSRPEYYDGFPVRVHVCVNVTLHDVTLLACGDRNPQINIERGEVRGAERAYTRLIEYAHVHMGREPRELPVVIEGVYHSERVEDGYRHTVYVSRFRPVK